MREQTFPDDAQILTRFPGARSYERGDAAITYLAERGGVPFVLIVPRAPSGETTVLEFEDEHERGTYLTSRDKAPI